MRVEISLGFVVSLRPKGAAFGQAGSTRLDLVTRSPHSEAIIAQFSPKTATWLSFGSKNGSTRFDNKPTFGQRHEPLDCHCGSSASVC